MKITCAILALSVLAFSGCSTRAKPETLTLKITSASADQEYKFSGSLAVDGITTSLTDQSTPWTTTVTANALEGEWRSLTPDAKLTISYDAPSSRPLTTKAESTGLGVTVGISALIAGNGHVTLKADPILPAKKAAAP